MAVTLPVVIGSVIGLLYDRRAARSANPEFAKRMGVLLATGMIVGDSLLNVAFAGIVAATGNGSPIVGCRRPGFADGSPIARRHHLIFGAMVALALSRCTAPRLGSAPAAPPASG